MYDPVIQVLERDVRSRQLSCERGPKRGNGQFHHSGHHEQDSQRYADTGCDSVVLGGANRLQVPPVEWPLG